jgi:hypothetical protein
MTIYGIMVVAMLYDGRFNQNNQYGDGHSWISSTITHVHYWSLKQGGLFFKYFEPDSPYERIPFVDKVCSPIAIFEPNF